MQICDKHGIGRGIVAGMTAVVCVLAGGLAGCSSAGTADGGSTSSSATGSSASIATTEDTGMIIEGKDRSETTDAFSQGMSVTLFSDDDPAADDGRAHDGWNADVSYSYRSDHYTTAAVQNIAAYGKDVQLGLNVYYPVFTGIENADAINEAVKAIAMESVQNYYLTPTSDAVALFEQGTEGMSADATTVLDDTVSFAVTYNTEDFVSVLFLEDLVVGGMNTDTQYVRCANINLATGEVYAMDDVMDVNDQVANALAEAFIATSYADGSAVEEHEDAQAIAAGFLGNAAESDRVSRAYFVDANGKVNVMCAYRVTSSTPPSMGTQDVTLSDELVSEVKKDSEFWYLLGY